MDFVCSQFMKLNADILVIEISYILLYREFVLLSVLSCILTIIPSLKFDPIEQIRTSDQNNLQLYTCVRVV